MNKFKNFLGKMKTPENSSLINTVKKGYDAISNVGVSSYDKYKNKWDKLLLGGDNYLKHQDKRIPLVMKLGSDTENLAKLVQEYAATSDDNSIMAKVIYELETLGFDQNRPDILKVLYANGYEPNRDILWELTIPAHQGQFEELNTFIQSGYIWDAERLMSIVTSYLEGGDGEGNDRDIKDLKSLQMILKGNTPVPPELVAKAKELAANGDQNLLQILGK